jgi:hypothetical protein
MDVAAYDDHIVDLAVGDVIEQVLAPSGIAVPTIRPPRLAFARFCSS